MPSIKTKKEIVLMQQAGKIAAAIMAELEENIAPDVTTAFLDQLVAEALERWGVSSSFKGYRGFPGNICTSINDVVVHGIPSPKAVLEEGDIIGIDLGVIFKGYHADTAVTFPVGQISPETQHLLEVGREARDIAIKQAVAGNRICDISRAVQLHVESNGCSVVRRLAGHGIGKSMHEEPPIPNFDDGSKGPSLRKGMTLAIEPMINMGDHRVKVDSDGWTVRTLDGSLSAHFEHTVVVGDDKPLVLTMQ